MQTSIMRTGRPGPLQRRLQPRKQLHSHCRPVQQRPCALLGGLFKSPAAATASRAAADLLSAIEGSQRGLAQQNTQQILEAVGQLAAQGRSTNDASKVSGTWRLVWTTEKETLWILKNAGLFGTQAGGVYQVVDVAYGSLQNVICFPPEGAFVVDSSIALEGQRRTNFKFTAATLRLPGGRALPLPPFGKGWFDTVYCDGKLRVTQDVRGDTLVCVRDGPVRKF